MRRLAKFFRLSAADRRLLLAAAGLSVVTWVGVRLLPLQRLARLLACVAPTFGWAAGSRSLEGRVRWALPAVSRVMPFVRNCLLQALVAQALFEKARLPSRLHIGVARDGDEPLRAHAWVERDGLVLIGGPGVERYTPLEEPRGGPR